MKKTSESIVETKFIGIHAIGKLLNNIWVLKLLIDHYKNNNLAWVPNKRLMN